MLDVEVSSGKISFESEYEVTTVSRFVSRLPQEASTQLVQKILQAMFSKLSENLHYDTIYLLADVNHRFGMKQNLVLVRQILAANELHAPRPDYLVPLLDYLLAEDSSLKQCLAPVLTTVYDCAACCPSSFALDLGSSVDQLGRLLPHFTAQQRADLESLVSDLRLVQRKSAGEPQKHIILSKPL